MQFKIVYADPPWTYNDKAAAGKRGAGFKYDLMDLAAIRQLAVQAIAAADSALFLWATMPLLREALEVMEAWGFQYKTAAFVWEKLSSKSRKLHWGMGSWTRANAELCLLGVRGKPKRVSAGVHQVVQAPVREHSHKPDEVRSRIVQLMGELPRIELFASGSGPGRVLVAVGRRPSRTRIIRPNRVSHKTTVFRATPEEIAAMPVSRAFQSHFAISSFIAAPTRQWGRK